jgi:dihydropteroate synthase
MGIVNVTPDSFSDGGEFLDPERAIAHGVQLAADGADILDVGGEATNPRATAVTAEVELARVLPVIRGLAARLPNVRLSIDTTKAAVATAAVAAGALIVNDVSGGLFDPRMRDALAAMPEKVIYVAGHLRGRTLAEVFAQEAQVTWEQVAEDLLARLRALPPAVARRAWIDPGLGFGKGSDPDVNLRLVAHAGDLSRAVDRPIVVGASRKRFVRRLLADQWADRISPMLEPSGDPNLSLDIASEVVAATALEAGAHVIRTHNVALLRSSFAVYTKR